MQDIEYSVKRKITLHNSDNGYNYLISKNFYLYTPSKYITLSDFFTKSSAARQRLPQIGSALSIQQLKIKLAPDYLGTVPAHSYYI